MEQRTTEWHAARLGKVTASRIADLTARTRSGYGASRANYMAELITERLSGAPYERFSNAAMQWGTDTEPLARSAYEVETGNIADQIGFVVHPQIKDAGASPDGLIGDDGLIEIKCPNSSTHMETLLSGMAPEKYTGQMYWQMACTGRKWCDFVSYDPRFPKNMRLFIKRINRIDTVIAELENEVRKFLGELESKLAELSNKYPKEDDNGV